MPVKLIPTDQTLGETSEAPVLRGDDPKFASVKINFFQYCCVAVLLFLISGFWQLQVQDPDYYLNRAERNRIRTFPIPGPRGKILDRDGRVIVDNHSSFSLLLSRINLRQEHLHSICEGLTLDCDDLRDRLRRYDRTRAKYEPIVIKEELTAAELAFVEAHRGQDTFPEMELIREELRLYPRDGLAAHVIGYTGEVSEDELNTAEFARYKQGDVIGKAGIERYYNDTLMRVDGQRRVVVDNKGRVRKVIDNKEAIPGKSIRLTIDLDLQAVAELTIENRRGAVVALDPRNGEVLAMASRPAYDPNKFAGRIRSREWNEIVNNPEKPLLNRAIQGQLAPGSTFKPIVSMAGLEARAIDESTTAHCTGGATFYGRFARCHNRKGGHGTVALRRAIAQSCDVYFYHLGNRLGIDKIAEYAHRTGLGQRTGIDLPGEAEGIVPSTRWKIRHQREKWYAGETISVAIGQGALTVTPIQLAHAIGGMAMGGAWFEPHLLQKDGKPKEPRNAEINADDLRKVVGGMYAVVNEGGTAARASLPGIEFVGKTGTAQIVSNDSIKANKLEAVKDNAWFVGFAPKENPEIIAVAVIEEGEHGIAAGQAIRDVIKAYFDKKSRQRRQPNLAKDEPVSTPARAGDGD